MPVTELFPTSIAFTSNADNDISPYQADDGTWSLAPGTGKFEIELRFTPPANVNQGVNQFFKWSGRKALAGGGNPCRMHLHIYENGVQVEQRLESNVAFPDESTSSDWSFNYGDYAADGKTLGMYWEQNSGDSGGPEGNWTWPEFDYCSWLCDHEEVTAVDVTEVITMVAFSLDGKGVSFTIPMLVIPGVTTIGLIGKGVVGVVDLLDVVGSTSTALTGQSVGFVTNLVSAIAKTSTALTGKAVGFALDLVSVIAGATTILSPKDVTGTALNNIVVTVSKATMALTGKAVTFVLNLLSAPTPATIVNSGLGVVTAVDLVTIIAAATVALTGRAVISVLDLISSLAAGSMALIGQAVSTGSVVVETVGKAVISVAAKAVLTAAPIIASVGSTAMGLLGRSVTTTTELKEAITAASLSLSGRSVFASLSELIASASMALTGRSVSADESIIESIAMQAITTTSLQAYFSVNTAVSVLPTGIALSGKAVVIPAGASALVGVATILLFKHNVTVIAAAPSTNTGLIRKISLPGVYTELWKLLVKADTVERL